MARRQDKNDVQELCKTGLLWVGRIKVYRRGSRYHAYCSHNGRVIRKKLKTDDPATAIQRARVLTAWHDSGEAPAMLQAWAYAMSNTMAVSMCQLRDAFQASRNAIGTRPSYLTPQVD